MEASRTSDFWRQHRLEDSGFAKRLVTLIGPSLVLHVRHSVVATNKSTLALPEHYSHTQTVLSATSRTERLNLKMQDSKPCSKPPLSMTGSGKGNLKTSMLCLRALLVQKPFAWQHYSNNRSFFLLCISFLQDVTIARGAWPCPLTKGHFFYNLSESIL